MALYDHTSPGGKYYLKVVDLNHFETTIQIFQSYEEYELDNIGTPNITKKEIHVERVK